MRELTSHKISGVNEAITIEVLDEPGAGGACHEYCCRVPVGPTFLLFDLRFQNGPIAEAGVNGLTHEVLLAILEDRLKGFQEGPYVNEDNANALFHIRQAMYFLQKRTRERIARGVEGTHQV